MSVVSLDSEEVAAAGNCNTVADAFAPHARRLVGRVARGFCDEHTITATELMSHPKHLQRYNDSGQLLQRAVQLVSGAQARVYNADLHKRMRGIFALAEKIKEVVEDIDAKIGPTQVVPGQLEQLMIDLSGKVDKPSLDIAMCIALSRYLEPFTSWEEKLRAVIDLMEHESKERIVIFMDTFVGDILDSANALKALFGETETLGSRLTELTWLHHGEYPSPNVMEPPDVVVRLNAQLAKREMPITRLAIRSQLYRALTSGAPVTRGAGLGELLKLIQIYEDLAKHGEVVGGRTMEEAIEKRMTRQAEPENLIHMLEDTQSIQEKVESLIHLQNRVLGATTKRQVGELVKMQFERREFGKELLAAGDSTSQKLKVVATLYDTVMDSELPDSLKERFGQQLEQLQMNFIKENKIFAKINKQSRNVSETVLKLADLCRSGLFTRGQNLVYVHSLIRHQLHQSEFKRAFLAGANSDEDKARRLADLRQKLQEAGLDESAVGKTESVDAA